MDRPRAADDFDTIRARIEELRREREATSPKEEPPRSGGGMRRGAGLAADLERRRRERVEGWPPPWVPTIFVRRPRS
jgi:hypothetical protein